MQQNNYYSQPYSVGGRSDASFRCQYCGDLLNWTKRKIGKTGYTFFRKFKNGFTSPKK